MNSDGQNAYPSVNDVAAVEALGESVGGDIFNHGQKSPFKSDSKDWTWGCISVSNDEMEEIYAMVQNDTLIALNP